MSGYSERAAHSAWRIGGAMIAMALMVVVLVGIGRGGVTLAHAEVERSAPANGETVVNPPEVVDVWFTQEVAADGTMLAVFAEDGTQVDLGDTTLDLNDIERRHVTVSLQPELVPGVYTVEWQSVSAEDGDTEEGSFAFTIAGAKCSAATPAGDASPVASPTAGECLATPTAEEVPEAGLGTPVTAGGLTVSLSLDPEAPGPTTATVEVRDASGTPVDDATVVVTAEHLEMDMGRFPKEAEPVGDGRYRAEVRVGMMGFWELEVTVTRPGGEQVTARFTVRLFPESA